ncbi:HNH endonuclease [Arthrobacter sp. MDT3-44]
MTATPLPDGLRAHINVTVPVLSLLGVDDAPAQLESYGPIPAELARRIAAHAPSFTRLLTHPETGAVLSVGRTSYAVPSDLKNWLRVRDRTCRHPGCNIPASRSEFDHTTPWARGGGTNHDNLAHLCRRHHMFKSEGLWHYEQARPGLLTATSIAGRTYTAPADDPPF